MPVIIPAATANPCRGPLRCKKVIDAHCVQVDGVIPCMSGVTNPYVDDVLRYYCSVLQNLSSGISTLQDLGIKNVRISLTSSQILNLHSSPIIAIPAPGAGKVIQLISATEQFTYGTSTYAGGTIVTLTSGSGGVGGFQDGGTCISSGSSSSSYFSAQTVPGAVGANQAVYVSTLSANPTTGDGTLIVYIAYQIITL